jgi:hypothetical protein
MKFLAILLMLIIAFSAALKRKRRSRQGSVYLNVYRIDLVNPFYPDLNRSFIQGVTTRLLVEYDGLSTIRITINKNEEVNVVDQLPNAENPDIILDIDRCDRNFVYCYRTVSPYEIQSYKFTAVLNDDNALKEIQGWIATRRLILLAETASTNFKGFSIDDLINFEKMSKYFQSLALYDDRFEKLWRKYLKTMKNNFKLEGAIQGVEGVKQNENVKKASDFFNEKVRINIISRINSVQHDYRDVKKAIMVGWSVFHSQFLRKNEYFNNFHAALYSWILTHSMDPQPPNQFLDRKWIYTYILNSIMLVVHQNTESYPFHQNLVFREYEGVKLLNLENIKQFEFSYKHHLAVRVRDQVERLKADAKLVLNK